MQAKLSTNSRTSEYKTPTVRSVNDNRNGFYYSRIVMVIVLELERNVNA